MLNGSSMGPFAVFALLYMTAFLMEMVEAWRSPRFTLAFLLAIPILIFTGITRIKFLIFLLFATGYFLIFRFPDVANHANLIIYCNIVLIVGMLYSFVYSRNSPTDDDYFDLMRPILMLTVILVYFLAGFHKLNTDFFNPEVSCAKRMLRNLVFTAKPGNFAIPTALIFAPIGGFFLWKFRAHLRRMAQKARILIAFLSCAGIMLYGTRFIIKPPIDMLAALSLAVLGVALMVILWELIGGPLLLVPKLQAPVLLFSWTMHAALAMIGFVDFGALALALLFAFVPPNYGPLLNSPVTLPWLGVRLHRAYIYFIINAISGILSGLHIHVAPFLDLKLMSGTLFNVASLIFIWPLVSLLGSPARRSAWVGLPVFNCQTPKWMFAFVALLGLYGMTSYLGLRTAGNFSMFSNLRTEGAVSNHLLLRGNSLKTWTYQEDVVRFIAIDDELAKVDYNSQPLQGHKLPVVEFKKLIYKWTRAGYVVPLTFEYQEHIYTTEDIVTDPQWRTGRRTWAMRLMDFRIIQPDGPNRCRW